MTAGRSDRSAIDAVRRRRRAAAAILAAAAAVVAVIVLARAPAVTEWRVARATVVPVAFGRGAILPPARVDVVPRVIGRVTKVLVRAGGTVESGDPLLELDGAAYAAQVEEARTDLARAEEEANRAAATVEAAARRLEAARALAGKKIASGEYLAAARLSLEKARAEQGRAAAALAAARSGFSAARDTLAQTRVAAPSAGRVAELRVRPGQTVSEATVVASIEAPEGRASVDVPAGEAEGIGPGSPARVSTGSADAEGTVRSVAPANKRSGSTYVRMMIALRTPSGAFAPGRAARARVEGLPRAGVLAVPIGALVASRRAAAAAVWTVEGDRVRRRPIATGAAGERLVEVRSGLREGETIVGGPAWVVRRLVEGDRVRVKGE